MKKLLVILLLFTTLLAAQTTSDVKPDIFTIHDGVTQLNTAVYYVDSAYVYQMVRINSYTETDMLNALLADFDNRVDKNIDFVEYRLRSIQRVKFVLTGQIIGYTLSELGLDNYKDAN
jgi:hypothetical protein